MPNLVGIGLSQVPTNSMLGGMAYQDPEHASIKNLDLKNLSQINSEIADTAVDVFVYDTRKDSDGGAWRKRTQHTSWYNETLGTATRGTRREFPAVAVIVAESDKVTIYDGDDPDLPMWMVLNADSSDPTKYAIVRSVGKTISSLYALNGIICDPVSFNGLFYQNFVGDACYRVNTTNTIFGGSIVNRNGGMNFALNVTSSGLVHSTVNDVAMTVLPNAPVDDTTGLPIPTIAVATDGGASFIRDDGNSYYYTFSSQNGSKVWEITFDENHQANMLLGYSNVYPYTCYQAPIPNTNTSLTSTTNNRLLTNSTFNFPQIAYKADNTPGDQIDHFIDSKYFGTTHGLSFLTPDRDNIGGQMLANITTEFNSGWMHGDIKGAFLSDTDTTNVVGTELVTNNDFDNGSTNWTTNLNASSGGYTDFGPSASYHAKFVQGTNSVWIEIYQDITTVPGKSYSIDLNVQSTNTSANWRVVVAGTTVIGYPTMLSQGHHYATFTASSTTTRMSIQQGGNVGVIGSIESLSVGIADPDRSVNNNGLQVFGTITKSAVATGADLVGYSGWTSSNYLMRPMEASDNPGSGDYSVSCWAKTGTAAVQVLFSLRDPGNSGVGWIQMWYNGPNFAFGHHPGGYITTPTTYADNQWHCFVGTRVGNTVSLYQDGKLLTTVNNTNNPGMPATSSQVRVGNHYDGLLALNGDLALLRYSLTAPSPEQVKKMYEDEKVLFQENAKATLYGSSDAVTALAFDDTTNLLHVGTSAGRSEFQGLRRINNTTDAVTTAISASNGLVAEQ